MAKQPYKVTPEKQLDVFDNFMGGLNTATSSANLADTELTDVSNIDLDTRGSLTRRYGHKSVAPKVASLKWSDLAGLTWKELI